MNTTATDLRAVPGFPDLAVLRSQGATLATARHVHDSLVLGAVLAGVRSLDWDGGGLELGPDKGFLLPPGLGHVCRDRADTRTVCVCLGPATLSALGRSKPWPNRALPLDSALVQGLAHRLEQGGDVQSALHHMSALLNGCVGQAAPNQDSPAPDNPDQAASQALLARDLLAQDLCDQNRPGAAQAVDCAGLAQRLGLTPWRLSRLFRSQIGLTMPEYRLHLRLKRAKKLLAQGAAPAYAALEAGFFDQSHLNREFRRRVGLTPAVYARSLADGHRV